jgi:hypothetical protein
MRAYRVENENGDGPYTSWAEHGHKMAYQHTDPFNGPSIHPGPYASFGSNPTHGEKFAFPSMQALFKWFGGWLPLMTRAGYHITVLELPYGTYQADEFQVMYDPQMQEWEWLYAVHSVSG